MPQCLPLESQPEAGDVPLASGYMCQVPCCREAAPDKLHKVVFCNLDSLFPEDRLTGACCLVRPPEQSLIVGPQAGLPLTGLSQPIWDMDGTGSAALTQAFRIHIILQESSSLLNILSLPSLPNLVRPCLKTGCLSHVHGHRLSDSFSFVLQAVLAARGFHWDGRPSTGGSRCLICQSM